MLGTPALPFRREDGRGVFPFVPWRRPRIINRDARPFRGHRGGPHHWRTAFEVVVRKGRRLRVEYCAGRDCFATREVDLGSVTA